VSVTYYVVVPFDWSEDGDLVAGPPQEATSAGSAERRARTLAVKHAGAVAFSRSGDPTIGEFQDAVVPAKVRRCRSERAEPVKAAVALYTINDRLVGETIQRLGEPSLIGSRLMRVARPKLAAVWRPKSSCSARRRQERSLPPGSGVAPARWRERERLDGVGGWVTPLDLLPT
jgi:hypothetical protein